MVDYFEIELPMFKCLKADGKEESSDVQNRTEFAKYTSVWMCIRTHHPTWVLVHRLAFQRTATAQGCSNPLKGGRKHSCSLAVSSSLFRNFSVLQGKLKMWPALFSLTPTRLPGQMRRIFPKKKKKISNIKYTFMCPIMEIVFKWVSFSLLFTHHLNTRWSIPDQKIQNPKCSKIQNFLNADMTLKVENYPPDLIWWVLAKMQVHWNYCIKIVFGLCLQDV